MNQLSTNNGPVRSHTLLDSAPHEQLVVHCMFSPFLLFTHSIEMYGHFSQKDIKRLSIVLGYVYVELSKVDGGPYEVWQDSLPEFDCAKQETIFSNVPVPGTRIDGIWMRDAGSKLDFTKKNRPHRTSALDIIQYALEGKLFFRS